MLNNNIRNEMKNQKQSFMKGTIIITLGMLAVKFFGAIFKIPLMSILGGEGSGYFIGAYNLYNPIYALSTAGLPIAISKLVSENVALGRFRDVRMIRRISVPIFLFTGTVGFFLVIIGSFVYSNISKSPDSIYSIFMLAPSLLFSCLMSSYRGYYEGLRNMTPTAVSEVVDSIGKILFGLSLSFLTIWIGKSEYYSRGSVFGKIYENEVYANGKILSFASAAAILGIAISSFVAFLYIHFRYKIKRDGISYDQLINSPKPQKSNIILKSILKIALPVGLGAIIMNLAGVIDSVLIQRRLADITMNSIDRLKEIYGYLIPSDVIQRNNVHTFLFGCFGYTSTIVMFLPTISQGLAISTLPTVTESWTIGDRKKLKKNVEKILKIASVVSIPMGLGISFFSYPIMDLIYNTFHAGKQTGEIYIASQIMMISGIGAIFIALSTPVCSMLQAIGRADIPLKILSIGMLIKIFLNYFLVGIPEINIQGAGIGTLVCYIFIFIFAIISLCKNMRISLNFKKILIKPFVAGLLCAFSALFAYNIFNKFVFYKIATMLSIVVSALVYLLGIIFLKIVTQEDLKSFNVLNRISKIFKKSKFT